MLGAQPIVVTYDIRLVRIGLIPMYLPSGCGADIIDMEELTCLCMDVLEQSNGGDP